MASNKREKTKLNAWLPEFKAISHNGQLYASVTCTHFVSAHQVIKEGGRRYMDEKDELRLQLKDDDAEGRLIHEVGVDAIVYGVELWADIPALLGLMREDNLDADIQRSETELDAFGHVCQLMNDLIEDTGPEGRTLTIDNVMDSVADMGFGNMPPTGWRQLVAFRLALSKAHAVMLFEALVQVCNGRVRTPPETYAQVNTLHAKSHPWIKVFIIMETYCGELLSEETGLHKKFSQAGTHPKVVRTMNPKAIRALGAEKELLVSFKEFFIAVVGHYNVDSVESEDGEKKTLANATLMKSLGRVLWKIGEALSIHRKKHGAKVRFVPDDSAALDKEAVVQHIMKDRFADIEKRYANYLEHAGTFAGDSPRPAPLNKRKPTPAKRPNVSSAISHNELPEAPSLVRLQQNGEIDTTMSPSDVCKILGLHGTGIGQLIGVRSHDVISGSGLASIPQASKLSRLIHRK